MRDTIDLLEAIGRDASLRHATPEQLIQALGDVHASDALLAAAVSGDGAQLARELGQTPNEAPQVIQLPGFDEDEAEPDGAEEPLLPSLPDQPKK